MSVRFYCDQCGKRIKDPSTFGRIKRKKGRLTVEVMVAVDGVWNSGHACPACVVDAVTSGGVS